MMKILKHLITVGLLLSVLTGCGSSADSAADYIESGKALLAEGKTEKARLQFKNAIQIDPRQAEPYYQLALLDEKAQRWKEMFSNLKIVVQLAPTRYDAVVKLGQLYLLGGDFGQALQSANKVLEADKNHVGAWVLRASIKLKQKELDAAMADVKKALALNGNDVDALSVKALILKEQGKPDEALAVLKQAVKLKPGDLPLTMLRLTVLEGKQDYAAMENIYRQLLKQRPDDNWVAISLAKLLDQQHRYEEAKQVLQDYVASHPEDNKVKILLISLVKTKEPEQAIRLMDSYLKQTPDNYELRFAKAGLLFDMGQRDAAVKELKRIEQMDVDGNNGRKATILLANYDAQQGNMAAALEKVNAVLAVEPENEGALLLKAGIDIENNKIDDAVTELRVVLRNNPESEQALVLLAQAYMKSGSTELAEDNFRRVLAVNPGNTVAALSVAESLLKNKELNRTEAVLTKALQKAKNKTPLLQALAQVRILKKDWLGTESVVDSLRVNKQDTAITHYLSGQIAQGREQYLTAIEEYKAALKKNPAMIRALQGLAFSYMKLDQKQQLLKYLNDFLKQHPDQLAAYAVLSSVYRQGKQWEQAIEILKKGLEQSPEWQGGYSALAAVYFEQQKPQQAIAVYQQGLARNEGSLALKMQLASAYERIAEYSKAKTLYEQILAKNPNIAPVVNNLASLLTDQFRSKDNLQRAAKLAARFKSATEPYFLDTYVWTQVQLGNYDKVQSILERIVSLSPNVAVFNYHLAVLYMKQGKKTEAEKYLHSAVSLAQKQGDKVTEEQASTLLKTLQ